MCRIDLEFYCDKCGSTLYETSVWGSYSDKLIDYYKKNMSCKHKHRAANNPRNIYYKVDFVYPEMRLGDPMICYNSDGEFEVQFVDRINYNYRGLAMEYYYRNDEGYKYIIFPKYTYMEFNDPRTVMRIYDTVAYISEHGFLKYAEISSIYSVAENYGYTNYLAVVGENRSFHLEDVYELSHFLMDLDSYNVNAKLNPMDIEHVNNRIKLYKEFKKYWVDKYYKETKQ